MARALRARVRVEPKQFLVPHGEREALVDQVAADDGYARVGGWARGEALLEWEVGLGIDQELDALHATVAVGHGSRNQAVRAPLPDLRLAGYLQATLLLKRPQLPTVIPEQGDAGGPVGGTRTEAALLDGVRPYVPPEARPDAASG